MVVGGYYNGVTSMFLPLEDSRGASLEVFGPGRDSPRWEWLSGLTKVRRIFFAAISSPRNNKRELIDMEKIAILVIFF